MKLSRLSAPSLFVALGALALVLGSSSSASALEKDKDGWYHTGQAIRVKTIVFADVNVYEIHHYMKEIPPSKSKEAAINLDVDKKLQWRMMREVGHEKMSDAMKKGFELNGFKDEARIAKFAGTFTKDMPENSKVTITYDSAKKATTIAVEGGGTATLEGVDFMKAVWSIWFGEIDQKDLGTSLLKSL